MLELINKVKKNKKKKDSSAMVSVFGYKRSGPGFKSRRP